MAPVRTKTWFINPFIGDRWVRRVGGLLCCWHWQRPPLRSHLVARTHARARRSDTKERDQDQLLAGTATRPAVQPTLRSTIRPANLRSLRYTLPAGSPDQTLSSLTIYVHIRHSWTLFNRGQLKLFPDFALLTRALVSR